MGYLEMTSSEFWEMQYNELLMRNIAYQNKKDAEFKHNYEALRWQSWLLIQPHLDKKAKINEPSDLIKFGWENNNDTKIIEIDVTEEQKEMFDKIDKMEFGNTGNEDVFDELFNEVSKKQQLKINK